MSVDVIEEFYICHISLFPDYMVSKDFHVKSTCLLGEGPGRGKRGEEEVGRGGKGKRPPEKVWSPGRFGESEIVLWTVF